jgi:prolyl-tRNA editing enzyme YbaK/EbsC (Cys-tRNA(Pro) deacylase)
MPVTLAVRALRAAAVDFTDHPYAYEDHGGTEVCARKLKVDEHSTIKTLIMEDDTKNPVVVLMHGDLKVSTKELARIRRSKGCNSLRTGYR